MPEIIHILFLLISSILFLSINVLGGYTNGIIRTHTCYSWRYCCICSNRLADQNGDQKAHQSCFGYHHFCSAHYLRPLQTGIWMDFLQNVCMDALIQEDAARFVRAVFFLPNMRGVIIFDSIASFFLSLISRNILSSILIVINTLRCC